MRKSKNRNFYHIFVSPGDAPGNHAKCCMDGKRIRCLQIASLHVAIYLLPFLRYSEIFVKKSSFNHTPLHSTPQLGGFTSEYRHPLWDGKTRMVSYPRVKKFRRYLFVLTWSTNVTDRHCVTAKTALASHRAVKMVLFSEMKVIVFNFVKFFVK